MSDELVTIEKKKKKKETEFIYEKKINYRFLGGARDLEFYR